MFYGTRGESSEGESHGVEASINSTPASVDFPEVKKKVGVIIIINCCNSVYFSNVYICVLE